MAAVMWQGSDEEYDRLHTAVARNCECASSKRPQMCAAHAMLSEQNVLDRLLWVFRTRRVFIAREFYARPVSIR
jgi:hypothetical protein